MTILRKINEQRGQCSDHFLALDGGNSRFYTSCPLLCAKNIINGNVIVKFPREVKCGYYVSYNRSWIPANPTGMTMICFAVPWVIYASVKVPPELMTCWESDAKQYGTMLLPGILRINAS